MNVVLLGPPGAGKGTQASAMIEALGLTPISTGNLLRQAVRDHTPLGEIAESKISKGEMVPDTVVIGLVEGYIKDHPGQGLLFDGFPRTLAQAEALGKLTEIDEAVLIDVRDETIESRMSGRRVCEKCGESYHVVANPPKTSGVCDKCGGNLIVRSDDKPEIVKHRLSVYHAETEPIVSYYRGIGKLITINGEKEPKTVTSLIIEALKNA